MSGGAFTYTTYELNSGDVCGIRVQPETLAANIGAANGAPAAARTLPVTAKVSKGNRGFGIKPRTVTLRFTSGAPADYKTGGLVTIPILQAATWDAISDGDTGTYLGGNVQVVFKTPERVK